MQYRLLMTREKQTVSLLNYCESQNFRGWDPYDGLNSRIFRFLNLHHSQFLRLAWIQLFKRSPFNLRKLFLVPKGHNAKGIGLFLSAYSKLHDHRSKGGNTLLEVQNLPAKIDRLASLLLDLRTPGYSGACWGYNFDWQARGGLFFPAGTPTVVATAYAAYGLFDAYEATGNRTYLEVALSSAEFITNDLSRTYRPNGEFLFSYSVLPGNNTVYNASLLGSKVLARCYHYTKNKEHIKLARSSVNACLRAQEKDGSWVYGELPIQNWKDSFHTGFNLEAISDYIKYSGDVEPKNSLARGFDYYIRAFFTESGQPKYYNNKVYPIDIHSPAQLVVTVDALKEFDSSKNLLDKVIQWTFKNMQSKDGFFFYQKKPTLSSRISYMRWSQAWMAHSLVLYNILHEKHSDNND